MHFAPIMLMLVFTFTSFSDILPFVWFPKVKQTACRQERARAVVQPLSSPQRVQRDY